MEFGLGVEGLGVFLVFLDGVEFLGVLGVLLFGVAVGVFARISNFCTSRFTDVGWVLGVGLRCGELLGVGGFVGSVLVVVLGIGLGMSERFGFSFSGEGVVLGAGLVGVSTWGVSEGFGFSFSGEIFLVVGGEVFIGSGGSGGCFLRASWEVSCSGVLGISDVEVWLLSISMGEGFCSVNVAF